MHLKAFDVINLSKYFKLQMNLRLLFFLIFPVTKCARKKQEVDHKRHVARGPSGQERVFPARFEDIMMSLDLL